MPTKGINDFLPGLLYFDDGNGFKLLTEAPLTEVKEISSDSSDKTRHLGMRSFTFLGQFDRTIMNQLTLAYIFGKSNNWRKIHGVPMKRRGRNKNWK